MRRAAVAVALAALAVAVLYATLSVDQTVELREPPLPGTTKLGFGYPVHFVELEVATDTFREPGIDIPRGPYWATFRLDAANGDVRVRPLRMPASYGLVLGALLGLAWAAVGIRRRWGARRPALAAAGATALLPGALFLLVGLEERSVVGFAGFAGCLAFAVGAFTSRPRVLAAGLVGGCALAVTIATLAVDRTVTTRAELAAVGFGYPIAFVTADLRRWTPPSFPRELGWNPWEDPAALHAARFLASYAVVSACLTLVAAAARETSRRLR